MAKFDINDVIGLGLLGNPFKPQGETMLGGGAAPLWTALGAKGMRAQFGVGEPTIAVDADFVARALREGWFPQRPLDRPVNADPRRSATDAGIIAYHGSPYRFRRFDPEKIGTGERTAYEGPGFYFSTTPREVNQYYRFAPRTGDKKFDEWSGAITFGLAVSKPKHWRTPPVYDTLEVRRQLNEQFGPYWRNPEFRRRVTNWNELEFSQPTRYQVFVDLPSRDLLDVSATRGEDLQRRFLAVLGSRPKWKDHEPYEWRYPDFHPDTQLRRIMNHIDPKWFEERMLDAGYAGLRWPTHKDDGSFNFTVFPSLADRIHVLARYGIPLTLVPLAMEEENGR